MKKNIYPLLVLLGMTALASFTFPNENEKTESFVRAYFDTFNKHDWTALSKRYHEEALFKSPTLGSGSHLRSRNEFIQEYSELAQMIPDVQDSVVSIHAAGQHIIVEFITMGTDPSGQKFSLPICTIFKIENDLIVEDFTYYDNF